VVNCTKDKAFSFQLNFFLLKEKRDGIRPTPKKLHIISSKHNVLGLLRAPPQRLLLHYVQFATARPPWINPTNLIVFSPFHLKEKNSWHDDDVLLERAITTTRGFQVSPVAEVVILVSTALIKAYTSFFRVCNDVRTGGAVPGGWAWLLKVKRAGAVGYAGRVAI
jgi:hypothetical protein